MAWRSSYWRHEKSIPTKRKKKPNTPLVFLHVYTYVRANSSKPYSSCHLKFDNCIDVEVHDFFVSYTVEGVTYERIKGTYTVKPVHFACSDNFPCIDVQLTAIELKPVQEKYHMSDPFCWQTLGELIPPTLPPIDCLQIGKPARNIIQSDHDVC
ncbi:unnamed protein product [Eruca vesicaria subsp. sativa]|uniref:Uncharacterized protein n=1 Tax=Eruca vesicaria subsp. sativa TaxID=29727 RepID=A0ABC8J1X0_ERUVS|nr:unnamed protein product [Eruca vesicaria subsp. sativa]